MKLCHQQGTRDIPKQSRVLAHKPEATEQSLKSVPFIKLGSFQLQICSFLIGCLRWGQESTIPVPALPAPGWQRQEG